VGRLFAISAIVLAAGWCVYANYLANPISASWGFSTTIPASDVRILHVQRVFPGSPADRAAIKRGDTLRALVSRGMIVSFPSIGQRATFQITRGKTQRTVTLTAAAIRFPRYPTEAILFACELVALALALLLVLRRWDDAAARALILYLICQAATLATGPVPDYVFGYIFPLLLLAVFLGYAGLVRFTATYPVQAPSSRFRRALAFWAPAAAVALGLVWFADTTSEMWLTFTIPIRAEYRYASLLFADVLPALGLISGLLATQAAERKRLAILLAFFLAGITGPIVYDIILANSNLPPREMRPLLATLIIMYAGFVYVIVRHRLFDIGFVLNRAAIYAALTTIFVPLFALLEWLAERYISSQNRTENILVQAGIMLMLFLSIRSLQTSVERFVDRWLFRERHENETGLRNFARHVVFMNDAQKIASQAVQAVCARTDASWSAIYEAASSGPEYSLSARCGDHSPPTRVDEDDPAIVAMRADRAAIEHLPDCAVGDALLLPLSTRGQLAGFIACGPKTSGESFAPDERDALMQLAHGVAVALDGVRLTALEAEVSRLRAALPSTAV
jgi:hypothetical protein